MVRKYGLIGYPLGHSFSGKFFTEKFRAERISDCIYENFPLEHIGLLPGLIQSESGLLGLNVTIPYKSDVIKFLHSVSPEAAQIGAVNVIKIHRTGDDLKLSGFNTDYSGFTGSLLPHLVIKSGEAIVMGTGGSSKAVCFALGKLGMKVAQVSRKPAEGVITYPEIADNLLGRADIIVNTTPLGMYPNISGKPEINYNALNPGTILFDLVYNPETTAFLQEGKSRGCITINGLRMLHIQAEQSWEIWNDENL
jgi:shikimate dehydrogenase